MNSIVEFVFQLSSVVTVSFLFLVEGYKVNKYSFNMLTSEEKL